MRGNLLKEWLISPFRLAGAIIVALVVTVVILLKIPSGDYLILPDIAHPVAPLVHVAGSKPAKGGGELYFVDVQEEQASELDVWFPWLHSHATLVPASELVPPGANNAEFQRLGLLEMKISKEIAAIVAERRLGYHVVFKFLGAHVDTVDPQSHARGILRKGDVIVAVNGMPALTLTRLRAIVSPLKPGTVVSIRIRRGAETRTVSVKTSDQRNRTVIGVSVSPVTKVVLPVKVAIDSGDIGGPSAGLAFTLEVLQQLGQDVTHGYRVAATGEMNLNGKVTAIGGVEQKTYGVREAGAQIFLVPADGGNAKTAEKFAGPSLRIIPVTSIGQALHALAALPKLK